MAGFDSITFEDLKSGGIESFRDSETTINSLRKINGLAIRYRDEDALRARIDAGDVSESLAEIGVEIPSGMEARIAVNDPGTFYFVIPPDPNVQLSDEELFSIAGGKTAGSAGTIGTAGSALCSTGASTISSAGSAGTAGTAS